MNLVDDVDRILELPLVAHLQQHRYHWMMLQHLFIVKAAIAILKDT